MKKLPDHFYVEDVFEGKVGKIFFIVKHEGDDSTYILKMISPVEEIQGILNELGDIMPTVKGIDRSELEEILEGKFISNERDEEFAKKVQDEYNNSPKDEVEALKKASANLDKEIAACETQEEKEEMEEFKMILEMVAEESEL